jgi:hypothetical protein
MVIAAIGLSLMVMPVSSTRSTTPVQRSFRLTHPWNGMIFLAYLRKYSYIG